MRKQDRRKLDPESAAYWEETLRQEGLSMEAGRNRRISYIGGGKEYEIIFEEKAGLVIGDKRRSQPKDKS